MFDSDFDDVTECLDVSVRSDGIDGSGNYKFVCRLEHTGHQSNAQSFGIYFSREVSIVEVPGDVEASAKGNHVQFQRNNQMNDNGLVDVWIKLSADAQPEVTGITDITCLPEVNEPNVSNVSNEPNVPEVPRIPEVPTDRVFGTVQKTIQERRSVRHYKPDMVPKDVIAQIMEAGTYAASGMNRQSPIILAVTNRKVRDKLSAMNAGIMGSPGTDPFYGAPVVLVVLADKNVPTYIYDGSLVIGNMMLAAQELGIGSCWIHRAKQEFESEEGKEILRTLGIADHYEGIGHLVLGYADGEKQPAAARKETYTYYID